MFSVPPPPPPNRDFLDVRQAGAAGDGVGDDTVALQAAIDKCIAKGLELFLPKGTYLISDTLEWGDSFPRIRGEGHDTVIKATDDNFDWLVVGTGTIQTVGPTGWIRDIRLTSVPGVNAPSGTTAGLRLSAAVFVEVTSVWVQFAPIGFALVNNNFGCSFYNCRTWDQECRIALFLEGATDPGTEGAGNDISFYNCWFHGRDAAVFAEGNQGFYHFYGGQLAAGIGTTGTDDMGIVTSGSSLAAPTTARGSVGLNFNGVTFERAHNGVWTFRHFGQGTSPSGLSLSCTMCSLFGGTNGGRGVLKLTGGYDDSVSFMNCTLNAAWSEAQPVSINLAGGASRPMFFEMGTRGVPTFNGVVRHMGSRPMFWGLEHAVSLCGLMYSHGPAILFSPGNGTVEVSLDGGATFPDLLSHEPKP